MSNVNAKTSDTFELPIILDVGDTGDRLEEFLTRCFDAVRVELTKRVEASPGKRWVTITAEASEYIR